MAGSDHAAAELRTAGRVLVLDRDDRVLLIHERTDLGSRETHWLTPGGGTEGAENPAEAAVREAFEETGLRLVLSADSALHVERHLWSLDGHWWDQTNFYFLARTDLAAPAIDPGGLTDLELDIVLGARWWTLAELDATAETIWPRDIVAILERNLKP
jgi:8-oxo-dGTP pyrophosphatase MutT (NUDIX family)